MFFHQAPAAESVLFPQNIKSRFPSFPFSEKNMEYCRNPLVPIKTHALGNCWIFSAGFSMVLMFSQYFLSMQVSTFGCWRESWWFSFTFNCCSPGKISQYPNKGAEVVPPDPAHAGNGYLAVSHHNKQPSVTLESKNYFPAPPASTWIMNPFVGLSISSWMKPEPRTTKKYNKN